MTAKRTVFQKAFNAIVEARARQAERFVAECERRWDLDGTRLTRR